MDELARGKFLRLVQRDGWEWAERVNVSGVVVIVARTPDDEVLFVEQHRIPVGGPVIEFPAGLAGDVDAEESLATAAQRELEEETGWRAGRLERLIDGPVSSGMTSETLTFFRADDLERVGPGGGEGSEDIVVHSVPRSEAVAWLRARREAGTQVDPKVYAGLFFLAS
ncbi:MAG: NUDIX hydrolase [Myxococcota bacterium]